MRYPLAIIAALLVGACQQTTDTVATADANACKTYKGFTQVDLTPISATFKDGGVIVYTRGDVTQTLYSVTGGTGIHTRGAVSDDGSISYLYWSVDLADIAKQGSADHALIFGDEALYMACE